MEITTKAVPESPTNRKGREKAEISIQISREHSRKGAGWMGTAGAAVTLLRQDAPAEPRKEKPKPQRR